MNNISYSMKTEFPTDIKLFAEERKNCLYNFRLKKCFFLLKLQK